MTTQKTRCPYCSSVFAVSNAQLAIRDGYTRCGKCFQVFKADDYLLPSNPAEASSAEQKSEKPVGSPQTISRSHIVDLHKIDSTKSRGFDNALNSFLDQKKLPSSSIIDFEITKKEKFDLSVLPNEHPEPEERNLLQLDPDAYLATDIEDPTAQLSHEFNEEWLTETAVPTNPLAQPIDQETNSNQVDDTNPESTAELNPESTPAVNESSHHEDLMTYLNKNSVPASRVNAKTNRALPSMNDFHANQRSKKKSKSLPMPINVPKRNQALDRLTTRKRFFSLDLFNILGWGVASVLMVALLVAQYIFFNFDHLAGNARYQPIMHKACLMLGCDVPLIDLKKIKMSNVLATRFKPSPLDSTIFTATMTNNAEESQPYPNLRFIVIKNKKVLSGRVIHPSEYLKTGYSAQGRIAPNHPTKLEFVLKIPRDEIPVFALDPVK